MTADYIDVRERPPAPTGERHLNAFREPEPVRPRPVLAGTLNYPVIPITSNLDTIPTVVGASSIIMLKLFMLGLLIYSL